MKSVVDMVKTLCYKLKMIALPIHGSANVFGDKKAVYDNTITQESVLKKKYHYIA